MLKGCVPWPPLVSFCEPPSTKERQAFQRQGDHRTKPLNRTGDDVLEMVNDIKVVFGKGRGSEPIPKDAKGHTPMWKKKSIFWKVPN